MVLCIYPIFAQMKRLLSYQKSMSYLAMSKVFLSIGNLGTMLAKLSKEKYLSTQTLPSKKIMFCPIFDEVENRLPNIFLFSANLQHK